MRPESARGGARHGTVRRSAKRLRAPAEVLVWWLALTVLWLMLIATPDPVEVAVGAAAAVPAALGARAARRAAQREVGTA